jgi:hypothetical protein
VRAYVVPNGVTYALLTRWLQTNGRLETNGYQRITNLRFVPLEEIAALEAAMRDESYRPNTAQMRLAEEVTRFVHGQQARGSQPTRLPPRGDGCSGSAGVPTRPAGCTGDGSRADSGIPPAASRQFHSQRLSALRHDTRGLWPRRDWK